MLEAGKGQFVPVKAMTGDRNAYAVKCGNKTFVYVFNDTKAMLKNIQVETLGSVRELDMAKVMWGKPFSCKNQIVTKVKPQQERVFVIE